MSKKILILGATGNFGSKIARALAKKKNSLILASRRKENLVALNNELNAVNSEAEIELACLDVSQNISEQLKALHPYVLINTCGPFQGADYSVAEQCIELGIHYIDLADGRAFVTEFHNALNQQAKTHHCLAITGASTVPGLSSAVLEHFKDQFSVIQSLDFGIAPGQKSERGLATTQGILSYVGKPLQAVPGSGKKRFGWQELHRQTFPEIGSRWMANCDIPDLDLLPAHYGIQNIRFSAGIENSIAHLGLWALSWGVRLGLPIHLDRHASAFLRASHFFDPFGSNDGGMYMIMSGLDKDGKEKTIQWFIIGKEGDGPLIPTIPAIVLAQKLIEQKLNHTGAMPCVGLVSLDEYLDELKEFHIQTYIQ